MVTVFRAASRLAIVAVVFFVQHALAQQTPIQMSYKFVESSIRVEFDNALVMLEENKHKITSPQMYNDALGGVKSSLYSKAVIQAGCIAEFCAKTRKGQNGETVVEYSNACSDDRVKACIRPKLLAYVQFIKSIDQYIALDRKQETGCLLKSRLFDLEMLLPPYDFLRHEGGAELHDHKILNECYLSRFK
jgi:hypothetical protein